jgi:quinol monooxygenase YgiN
MTEFIANAVFLRSRAGTEEELASRLEELVLASRSDPGVLIYDLRRSAADPNWPEWYAKYMVAEQTSEELPR